MSENENETTLEKKKKGRKPKNPDAKPKERTEAQKEAQRNYYLTKLKNDPVYQAKQRESSKKHYYKHQEIVKEKEIVIDSSSLKQYQNKIRKIISYTLR